MTKARITSQLQLKLAQSGINFPLTEQELVFEFSYWRMSGPASSKWFGRTVSSSPPDALEHTHFAPYDDAEYEQWERNHKNKSYQRMGSKGYVLWAKSDQFGDLLIDVIIEPDAHDLWKPAQKALLDHYLTVADNFCFNGTIP